MPNSNKSSSIDRLSQKFILDHPNTCANLVISKNQKYFYLISLILIILFLLYRWDLLLFCTTLLLSLLYLASAFFRLVSAFCGFFHRYETAEISDDNLPIYTILLPMYKEANIAAALYEKIANFDYPIDKLDVKFLLEADDIETKSTLEKLKMPSNFQIIIMDACLPKTKPRACNYGLEEAKGEFCVIYDAEDKPEKDQLKKAIALFRAKGEDVACVQAKLNYHNSKQNLLTRLFTIEYTTHFDLLLPGMQIFNFPLPLGGTSNHFRTSILKKIGGWDPFNVTEDCDLGLRIYEKGYKTLLLDSTTWEEANSKVGNWIRQRSRWIKGFIQTHLVHYRNYPVTIKRLNLWGTLGGFLAIGGSSLMILCNIIFTFFLLIYGSLLIAGFYQGIPFEEQLHVTSTSFAKWNHITWKAWPIMYTGKDENIFYSTLSIYLAISSAILFAANFIFIFIGFLGCLKRKFYHLLAFTPLMIFYWLLMSIAGWKGFLQLFYKPFYWEKTTHGLNLKNNPQSK